MPSIPIHPPSEQQAINDGNNNPLPSLLHTPAGLAMIELQGTVLSEHEQGNSDVANALRLGKLIFPEADDGGAWDSKKVFLFVGSSPERTHQRMVGEVKKLTKPVAVLRRRVTADADAGDEVEIAEIIQHKILFHHRPEPMGGGEQLLED